MASSGVRSSNAGFSRAASHARAAISGAALARQRAVATLVRRIGTETVRTISGEILNLPQGKVRPYIGVRTETSNEQSITVGQGSTAIVVSASRYRLPLTDYRPKVSKAGVVVTTWRDSAPLALPHAFVRRDKPGIWQRVPFTGGKFSGGPQERAPSGLVERLPIVQRKGPSMHRVFVDESGGRERAHGNVAARLRDVARETLEKEVERLRKSLRNS